MGDKKFVLSPFLPRAQPSPSGPSRWSLGRGGCRLRRMHHASTLVLPAGAPRPHRPVRERRGTRRLSAGDLGLGSRAQLLQLGLTDARLRRHAREGTLQRIAPGWYARPDAAAPAVRALAAGFRLTCLDAAEMHGLWVPHRPAHEEGDLHVYRFNAVADAPPGMRLHASRSRSWTESDAVASLPLALEHAMQCLDGESAAVLLESALERRLLTAPEVEALLARAPIATRSRIGALSTASDSGSETRVVRWLRRRGFHVEQQVHLAGVGFLDVYVGGLFLEIDGRAHHEQEDAFLRDRRRDLRTVRYGLQILRLSYEQVWTRWEDTRRAILDALDEVGAFGRRKVDRLLDRPVPAPPRPTR